MINVMGFLRDASTQKMEAVEYYRTFLPLREVNRAGNGINAASVAAHDLEDKTDAAIGGRDIYTMCRLYQTQDFDAFQAAVHDQGAKLVLDSDDDLTEDYKLVNGRGDEFKEVLGKVDYVTTSTPALAAHFGQFTKEPPTVLRNHIDSDWMIGVAANARRLTDELTIGFIGSPTHWGDWRLPSVPFARIVQRYDVRPMLAGGWPHYLRQVGKSSIQLGPVPFAVYPIVLKQFDIVLCAVNSADEFNAGKSAVKALECLALGIVPICSRFKAYLELAEAGAPIILVEEDSADGWYEAMRSVIHDEGLRQGLLDSGPKWVGKHRDMTISGHEHWARFYQRIARD